jgi:hypothetical protein
MMWPLLLCESQRTLRLFTLRIEGCVIFSLDSLYATLSEREWRVGKGGGVC